MGKWFEKQLTGDVGGKFWKNIEAAKPHIQQQANAVLKQLGYDSQGFTSHVFFAGGGEEVWTVAYWRTPPANTVTKGDLEVYLNIRGEVKRVAEFEYGQEQLIYGKDERIPHGLTPAQVRERLGEPDYRGTPRHAVRDVCDELWKYKQNTTRTMTIEVCFKDGEVASVSYFGD